MSMHCCRYQPADRDFKGGTHYRGNPGEAETGSRTQLQDNDLEGSSDFEQAVIRSGVPLFSERPVRHRI